jgi:hypothetical protein
MNFGVSLLWRTFLFIIVDCFLYCCMNETIWKASGLGGLEVACWTLVSEFACSHLAESVGFFRVKKIFIPPSFRGEVKLSVPCCSFTACKISLNATSKSVFRQNSRTFLAHSFTFCHWVLSHGNTRGDAWWQKLECLTQIAQ